MCSQGGPSDGIINTFHQCNSNMNTKGLAWQWLMLGPCCSAAVQDFVSAVMDVDYSPTGREFVAGGYDRSVRIFSYQGMLPLQPTPAAQ
jgi:hypothetical protein